MLVLVPNTRCQMIAFVLLRYQEAIFLVSIDVVDLLPAKPRLNIVRCLPVGDAQLTVGLLLLSYQLLLLQLEPGFRFHRG